MKEREIKQSRFPLSLFGVFAGALLLMSGIHTGLIVLMGEIGASNLIQTIVPMLYWSAVAAGLTVFTRMKIEKTYDAPTRRLAEAAKKVAKGDFSVYVPPINTGERFDYLDEMIVNFDKMVEELGSIETLKTDFVSNVSHEMKTPIALIKGYAQIIKQKGECSDEAQKIIDAAERLSDLITNILRLNKLESQSIVTESEDFDVCSQLCECVLQFEKKWEEKGIEMIVDCDDAAFVRGDKALLEIVWNNLISNAIKFTDAGGRIEVSAKSDGETVIVSIADTGCGMKCETREKIFDKFYQGDTSHAAEGNGLGLALVKRVMDLTGGEIAVMSQEGKGSVFTVTLPCR
ncbi:MAG: HAMP domain-containing histidine kinase [Clostridia bacterium]|nr:HAMP domain-containing histidine kinase [Clostridia bacterium]